MKEEWRDIKEYEGLYRVSDLGNIKSLNYNRTGKEQVLKPLKQTSGHLNIGLCKDGAVKSYRIHRIVLETFVNPCPPGMECRHLDGNPENNKLDNLKWGTRKENVRDSIDHKTFKFQYIKGHSLNVGSKHGMSKLNEMQVRIIKRLLRDGYLTHKEIGKIFNVSRRTIGHIGSRYTWDYI